MCTINMLSVTIKSLPPATANNPLHYHLDLLITKLTLKKSYFNYLKTSIFFLQTFSRKTISQIFSYFVIIEKLKTIDQILIFEYKIKYCKNGLKQTVVILLFINFHLSVTPTIQIIFRQIPSVRNDHLFSVMMVILMDLCQGWDQNQV